MVDIEKGIKAYSREGLAEFMESAGMPAFRAKQIEQWLYQKGATSYDEMTNLSKDMRTKLAEAAPLYSAEIDDRQVSCDGTRKYIVRYADGCTAEMVAMPSGDRLTVCVSSQVGCAMACSFCATGKEGFTRNLLPGEIVEQVLIAQNDMGTRVNLLPLNNVPGSPSQPASKYRVDAFIRTLERAGVEATMRDSRGGDIAAACGQLKNQKR